MFRNLLIFTVNFYRKCLSPLKLPSCRFHPTCSQYALECLCKFNLHDAILRSVKRIFKCHPFHPGGYDPVE